MTLCWITDRVMSNKETSTNRVLVVDDDASLIGEYVRCLGEGFEPEDATATLTDLEKVLFGEETDERGAAKFEVHSRNQGAAAVEAVQAAIAAGQPYSIVFLDIRMPPGMDGIEAAKRIRLLDANINIVVVSDSKSPAPENLGKASWEFHQLNAPGRRVVLPLARSIRPCHSSLSLSFSLYRT